VSLTVLQTNILDDAAGFGDAYALRSLTLENKVTLTLDGNALTNALYVDQIDIGTNALFRMDTYIIGNGINIYYNADNEENRYLAGLTYNLGSGGRLIPISVEVEAEATAFGTLSESASAPGFTAVPEPTSGVLAGLGLLVLAARRRRL
jgi:hypothetical protein